MSGKFIVPIQLPLLDSKPDSNPAEGYYKLYLRNDKLRKMDWLGIEETVGGEIEITTTQIANWDAAYSWGNHANAGYVTLSTDQQIDGVKTFASRQYFNSGITVNDGNVEFYKSGRTQPLVSIDQDNNWMLMRFNDLTTSETNPSAVALLFRSDQGFTRTDYYGSFQGTYDVGHQYNFWYGNTTSTAGLWNINFLGTTLSNRPLMTINNGAGSGLFNTPVFKLMANGNLLLGLGTDAGQKLQVNGNVRATGYVVTSGTSAQFLKADGSLDSNTYLTSSSASGAYVSLSGSYANPTWITSLAWNKITGAPAFITGITSSDVTTALGYTPVTNARTLTINGTVFDLTANRSWTVGDLLSTGSYANPSWITSLAYSKITGVPAFLTAEADTLDSVTGRGATTTNTITVGSAVATSTITVGVANSANGTFRVERSSGNTGFVLQASSGNILGAGAAPVWQPYNYSDASNNFNIGHASIGNFNWYAGGSQNVTSNAHLMRLTRGGNLLIGTTTDAGYRLDVNGSVRIQSSLRVDSTVNASTGIARGVYFANTLTATADSDVLVGLDISPSFSLGTFTSVSQYGIRSSIGAGTNKYNIYVNGSADNYFAGNVGIGTTTPFVKLHVYGTDELLRFGDGTSGNNAFMSFNDRGYLGFNGSAGLNFIANTTRPIVFGTGSNFSTYTEWARFQTSTGYFGIGTTNPTAPIHVSKNVTATGAIARGVYFTQTLTAAANNDVLVGLDINPTFTVGGFTGVTQIGLRINGDILPSGDNIQLLGSVSNRFNNIYSSQSVIGIMYTGNIRSNATGGVRIWSNNANQWAQWFDATGNLLIQNGGTFTDSGYRLDVAGTARVQNDLTVEGIATATVVKKQGGTSTQFLKADGSVDNNSYATNNLSIAYAIALG